MLKLLIVIAIVGVVLDVASATEGSKIPCRTVDSAVQTFTNEFVNGILFSFPPDLVRDFTEQNLTAEMAGEVYSSLVEDINGEVGTDDDDLSSQVLSMAVAKNFDKITPLVLIQNYAKNTGQVLEVLGTLTDDNAGELGQQFFNATRNRILAETDLSSSAPIQLKSIANGLEDFLKMYNDFTKETVPIFAAIYAQEWYTL